MMAFKWSLCIKLQPGPLSTLRLSVLPETWIRSDVSQFRRQSVKVVWHRFREAGINVTRAETGAPCVSGERPNKGGGTEFRAWRLRSTFLGECREGLRHFSNHRECIGYGVCACFQQKKMCHTRVYQVYMPLNKKKKGNRLTGFFSNCLYLAAHKMCNLHCLYACTGSLEFSFKFNMPQ